MSEASTPQTDPQQAQTPPEPVQLPGRRLREAREGQGLTQEEAAERLHLHHSQVAALENDDYAHFSAPIFIRGYLNNYARLLGLDPEEVVRALEQQGLEQPPILSELTAAMPSVRRHGMPMHIRAVVLAGGTIVFLAALSGCTTLARQPVGVVRGDPDLRAMFEAAMREAWSTGRAKGVALPDDLVAQQMRFLDGLPAEMRSSMQNDLAAGNRLEVPWLSGAVVRMARECGIDAPVSATILAALKPYCAGAAR